jgi:hypothetical protein
MCASLIIVHALQVALFHLVPDKATGVPHWVYLDRKQPHTHDVRSLTPLLRPDSDPLLLSGGNDGQIVLYSLERFLKEHPTRQSKSPQRPLLQLATAGHPARLLHAAQRSLSVWQLGRAVASQALQAGEAAGGQECEMHYRNAVMQQCTTVNAVMHYSQCSILRACYYVTGIYVQGVLGTL